MADNTDEEHLDNPINNQPENPTDEIIPTSDMETINSIQETENMEVHHHAHDPAAPHYKKNWKSYFWEFLMLFLAVFCGFLAEYQLEHKIERDREKQYMESLVSDLSADTATINYGIPRKEGKIKAIDSIFTFFSVNKSVPVITGKLFRTLRRTTWDQRIDRNNITISQLKNAGNMRLVRKKTVADSIAAYDMHWIYTDAIYRDSYNAYGESSNRFVGKLVNPDDLLPFYITNTSQAIVTNIPDSLVIRVDIRELKEHLNFMMQQKINIYQQIQLYNTLRESAERLISLIKKEYQLK
jgi:hypothetical protein